MTVTMNNIVALILNYNTYILTKECVDSLLKFSNELNILIIDNGSTDSSFNELENEYKFEKK